MTLKKVLVLIAATLVALLPATAASAAPALKPANVGITGMWLGTSQGYENGAFKSTEVRYTITAVDGVFLTGTKSWLMKSGTWSEPESFQGVLYKTGAFYAADHDGYLIGELVSPTKIRATYLEAGDDEAALVTVLTKASRSKVG